MLGLGQLAGLGGAGLASIFGGMNQKNPAGSAMKYFNKIPGTMMPFYNPYLQQGQQAGGALQGEYSKLLGDPGALMNKIGAGYQKSPGFDFAMKQALQGAGHAAAAGGMAGSPQHEQQSQELATNLANQDYNNWLQQALGLYGAGLSGQQGMYGIGANMSNDLAQSLANNLASQGSLAFQGQAQQNKASGDMWSTLASLGLLGAFS